MADGLIVVSDTVTAALTRAIAAGQDLSPAMIAIANSGVDQTEVNFEGEHDPLGVPWVITKRKEENPAAKILTDTRDLRGSIKADSGADFAAWGPESSFGAAGYAAAHQWGAVIRRKVSPAPRGRKMGPLQPGSVTLPARAYVGWSPTLTELTLGHLADHLGAAFEGASRP